MLSRRKQKRASSFGVPKVKKNDVKQEMRREGERIAQRHSHQPIRQRQTSLSNLPTSSTYVIVTSSRVTPYTAIILIMLQVTYISIEWISHTKSLFTPITVPLESSGNGSRKDESPRHEKNVQTNTWSVQLDKFEGMITCPDDTHAQPKENDCRTLR
jgi:hypothetical protein